MNKKENIKDFVNEATQEVEILKGFVPLIKGFSDYMWFMAFALEIFCIKHKTFRAAFERNEREEHWPIWGHAYYDLFNQIGIWLAKGDNEQLFEENLLLRNNSLLTFIYANEELKSCLDRSEAVLNYKYKFRIACFVYETVRHFVHSSSLEEAEFSEGFKKSRLIEYTAGIGIIHLESMIGLPLPAKRWLLSRENPPRFTPHSSESLTVIDASSAVANAVLEFAFFITQAFDGNIQKFEDAKRVIQDILSFLGETHLHPLPKKHWSNIHKKEMNLYSLCERLKKQDKVKFKVVATHCKVFIDDFLIRLPLDSRLCTTHLSNLPALHRFRERPLAFILWEKNGYPNNILNSIAVQDYTECLETINTLEKTAKYEETAKEIDIQGSVIKGLIYSGTRGILDKEDPILEGILVILGDLLYKSYTVTAEKKRKTKRH